MSGHDGPAPPPGLPADAADAIAIGWATVELDRAAGELGGLLEPGAAFVPAPGSAVLGAHARVARVVIDGIGRWLILLEPSTEGRLAAFLARHGEGWAATWIRDEAGATEPGAAWRDGPLGPERLAARPRTDARFRLVVPAATIDP